MCLYEAILAQRSRFSVVLACVLGHFLSLLGKITKILFSKLKKLEYKKWSRFCSKMKHEKVYLLTQTPYF